MLGGTKTACLNSWNGTLPRIGSRGISKIDTFDGIAARKMRLVDESVKARDGFTLLGYLRSVTSTNDLNTRANRKLPVVVIVK